MMGGCGRTRREVSMRARGANAERERDATDRKGE